MTQRTEGGSEAKHRGFDAQMLRCKVPSMNRGDHAMSGEVQEQPEGGGVLGTKRQRVNRRLKVWKGVHSEGLEGVAKLAGRLFLRS